MDGGIYMQITRTTHNIQVTEEEYNRLGANYPRGKYVKIGDYDTFSVLICSQYPLGPEQSIEIIFWRNN